MTSDVLIFPPFLLETTNQQLWRGDYRISIRAKTFAVLRHLAENPCRLITHGELVEAVWRSSAVSESLLRGYIRDVRRILHDDADRPRFVETVPGRGYRFIGQLAGSSSMAPCPWCRLGR